MQDQKVRVVLASIFLVAFVGLSLLLLTSLRDRYVTADHHPYEEPVELTQPGDDDQLQSVELDYPQIYALLETELLNGPESQGWQKLPADGSVQRLKMFGDYPQQQRLLDLAGRIAATGAPAQLDLLPRKGFVRLYWQHELRLELRYRARLEASRNRPQVAIIMDDMGRSLQAMRTLLSYDLPVTPAILPYTSRATEAALLFQQAGREYMIHMPMQPNSYPNVNPGPNPLLIGQSETETRRLVRSYMDRVPGAVGGNNHMGSRYTQDRSAMRVVLDELQQQSLFFIDSKTIGSSVAYDEARRMKVPTAARQIFLDNREDVDYIRAQIRAMVRMAGERGELIAICHPHQKTFEALQLEMPWLQQQPIDFVPPTELVRVY